MKVKIFQGYSTVVQSDINNFLKNSNISIIDIRLSTEKVNGHSTFITVLILYKEDTYV